MPTLVLFLARHALVGFALAVVFVGALLAFDVARLGTLVWGSPSGLFAVAALTFAVGLTFASAQMGFAIMLLGEETGGGRGGGRAARVLSRRALLLVPVPARKKL
jgi:membrane glycosyltransferase